MIVRDIQTKYKIRNQTLMNKIINFMIGNASKLISIRSITSTLKTEYDRIDHKTIGNYLQYLCRAFAFYKIPRYDVKGKRYLLTNDKYYLSDTSFRYAKVGTKDMDYGHMIENVVAIELLRRGYEVYVGVLYQKEIDFVAIKRNEKIYIQVSDNLEDPETFEREVSPLLKIRDGYRKMVLARTRRSTYRHKGIWIVDVANWLLHKDGTEE